MEQLGRRQRKLHQTRDDIATAARSLFAEHGFDGVTVAEVAEAADVSEQTVYNHFPTKEDLVMWRRGTHEANLVAAIRGRPVGQSALGAFHQFIVEPPATLDRAAHDRVSNETTPDAPADGSTMGSAAQLVMDTPALRARERSIVADQTAALAALLATETEAGPDDIAPWVAATAIFGVSQALIDFARRRVIEGTATPELRRQLRRQADRAVALLAAGLDDYGVGTIR